MKKKWTLILENWPFAIFLSFVLFYFTYLFFLNWNWGLMDDVGFILERQQHPLTLDWLSKTVKQYFNEGRYYPVGVFFKHLSYMILPPVVMAHRAIRFIQVLIIGSLIWFGILNKVLKSNHSKYFALIIWFSAFCFRDGLDLYSTVEVHGLIYAFIGISISISNVKRKFSSWVLSLFFIALATLTKETFFIFFGLIFLIEFKKMYLDVSMQSRSLVRPVVSLALGLIWAIALNSLRHAYTQGFASSVNFYTVGSIFLALFRNYHLLTLLLMIGIGSRIFRIDFWSFTFLSGFFIYALVIALWGTTDTFLYLHYPALPLLAIGIARIVDQSIEKKNWSMVYFFISAILFVQTVRGSIRAFHFNQESDSVSQMLTLFEPNPIDAKIWTNCEEASGTLVRYAFLKNGFWPKGITTENTRWMYRLFEAKSDLHPRGGDWIVYSKKCYPYSIQDINVNTRYIGQFYQIYSVK